MVNDKKKREERKKRYQEKKANMSEHEREKVLI